MNTQDYLDQLEQDREDLVDNLETQGITGLSGDETFTELVPKVLDIEGGTSGLEFSDITLLKLSTQSQTPLPEYPVDVENVTNNVTISIDNGTKTVTIPLGVNDVGGIGTYKDELIVDKTGHCYLNKKISSKTLTGANSENWTIHDSSTGNLHRYWISYYSFRNIFNDMIELHENYLMGKILCNRAVQVLYADTEYGTLSAHNQSASSCYILYNLDNTDITDISKLRTWLSTHNEKVYYVLNTANLIDLNTTIDLSVFEGATSITNDKGMDMIIGYKKYISNT